MDARKSLIFFLILVLVGSIFWNGALRLIALSHPDSNWAKGLLHDL